MDKKEPSSIPEKLYYKIGEVSEITGIEPYVLRYWESEFRVIKPFKSGSLQRLYRRKDLDLILRIKKLLYEEGFTIAGAKRKIRDLERTENAQAKVKAVASPREGGVCELLTTVREELKGISKMLDSFP